MKFLLDQCVMGKTKRLLEEAGYSALTLKELGKSTASNGEVIKLAIDFMPNLHTPLLGVKSFLNNFILTADYHKKTFSLQRS